MTTDNQKSTVDTQKEKKNTNTTLNIIIKITKRENKRGREKTRTYKNKSKPMNKMAIRAYMLIITVKVNGLNAPTEK